MISLLSTLPPKTHRRSTTDITHNRTAPYTRIKNDKMSFTMQANIKNIKEFYTFTSMLEKFEDNVKFNCTSEGIYISCLAHGNTCIVKAELEKLYFDNYVCPEPMAIGIRINVLNSILKKMKNDEVVEFKSNGEVIIFYFGNSMSTTLKLLDMEEEDMQPPEVQYNFSATLNPFVIKQWQSTILDITKSDVQFVFQGSSDGDMDTDEQDKMTMKSEGDVTVEKIETMKFNICNSPEPIKLSNKSMTIISSLSQFNRDILMCFQNACPIEFNFNLNEHAIIKCWFAPMMTDDEMQD